MLYLVYFDANDKISTLDVTKYDLAGWVRPEIERKFPFLQKINYYGVSANSPEEAIENFQAEYKDKSFLKASV